MRFMRIVAALVFVACGLTLSACRPPIPKVGMHMATCFTGTFPSQSSIGLIMSFTRKG